jgi:hypothetical protein
MLQARAGPRFRRRELRRGAGGARRTGVGALEWLARVLAPLSVLGQKKKKEIEVKTAMREAKGPQRRAKPKAG